MARIPCDSSQGLLTFDLARAPHLQAAWWYMRGMTMGTSSRGEECELAATNLGIRMASRVTEGVEGDGAIVVCFLDPMGDKARTKTVMEVMIGGEKLLIVEWMGVLRSNEEMLNVRLLFQETVKNGSLGTVDQPSTVCPPLGALLQLGRPESFKVVLGGRGAKRPTDSHRLVDEI